MEKKGSLQGFQFSKCDIICFSYQEDIDEREKEGLEGLFDG